MQKRKFVFNNGRVESKPGESLQQAQARDIRTKEIAILRHKNPDCKLWEVSCNQCLETQFVREDPATVKPVCHCGVTPPKGLEPFSCNCGHIEYDKFYFGLSDRKCNTCQKISNQFYDIFTAPLVRQQQKENRSEPLEEYKNKSGDFIQADLRAKLQAKAIADEFEKRKLNV